jgi:hypothetical protein
MEGQIHEVIVKGDKNNLFQVHKQPQLTKLRIHIDFIIRKCTLYFYLSQFIVMGIVIYLLVNKIMIREKLAFTSIKTAHKDISKPNKVT